MTRIRKLGFWVVGTGLAIACGARTGDEQLDDDGFGGLGAAGGKAGKAGSSSKSSGGAAGTGFAGRAGIPGNGGRAGLGGGFGAGGISGFCQPPRCVGCYGCFDNCVCQGFGFEQCQRNCLGSAGAGGAAGRGGRGGSTGRGGFGGFAGSGGFGGGTAGVAGGGTFCGGQLCTDVRVAGLTLSACCPGPSPNACGIQTAQLDPVVPIPPGCVAKNQPGRLDPSCPSLQTGGLSGCCRPDGLCGIDYSVIELGCVFVSPFGGPPLQACGPRVDGGAGRGGSAGFGGGAGIGGTGGASGMSGAAGRAGGGGRAGSGGIAGFGGSSGSSGSCCQAHAGGGCDDPTVTRCVCQLDPFCCTTRWDLVCAGEASSCGARCGGAADGGSAAAGGGGGTGGVSQCVAQASNDCQVCLCTSCLDWLGPCIGDVGCMQILNCVAVTGCSGSGCYQPNTCQPVIDSFGGLGSSSASRAISLYQCQGQANCPCGLN